MSYYQRGEVVQLKKHDQPMVVDAGPIQGYGTYSCIWQVNGVPYAQHYHEDCLEYHELKQPAKIGLG